MAVHDMLAKLQSNSESTYKEAIRVLMKIADNIVKNPGNLKIRSLQKNNSTIRSKILSASGGAECLKLMGFEETDTTYVMPPNVSPDKAKEILNYLADLEHGGAVKGAIPKPKVEQSTIKENEDDLSSVKRFILPPLSLKYTNSFLRRLETQFHSALAFSDKDCQRRAKKLIPLNVLETNAQQNLQFVNTRIKKEKLVDPEFSIQDMLLLELLTWFKEEFFSWVDAPNCTGCGSETAFLNMSSDPKDLVYTDRVEVYKCKTCSELTKFPRYNDLNILLETRRGRCGEWALVFTLLCISLGWDARYVVDEGDHVWTEVYSITRKRWVHCDSCENACDTPLMYETGWNKKLTYITAFSPNEVQDVTWRYSSNHNEVLQRRKQCTETELVNTLISLREERQKTFSVVKRNYLTRRLISELVELMVERKPNENEKQGRISGSKEWRIARGEVKNENMYVWRIGQRHILNNEVIIRYSAVLDVYEFVKGNGSLVKIKEWNSGVYSFSNIFHKEEKDWKVVYLARCEGTDTANISWRYELESDATSVIDNINLKFKHQVFENGVINIKLISDDINVEFPYGHDELKTQAFSGRKYFTIFVSLEGGKGDVAWQHTQLFRQPKDCLEYPFILSISFK